jgi:hypothetical protein
MEKISWTDHVRNEKALRRIMVKRRYGGGGCGVLVLRYPGGLVASRTPCCVCSVCLESSPHQELIPADDNLR